MQKIVKREKMKKKFNNNKNNNSVEDDLSGNVLKHIFRL